MPKEIPCETCIALPACKGKSVINCKLLDGFFALKSATGANTLDIIRQIQKLLPHAQDCQGTIIL